MEARWYTSNEMSMEAYTENICKPNDKSKHYKVPVSTCENSISDGKVGSAWCAVLKLYHKQKGQGDIGKYRSSDIWQNT